MKDPRTARAIRSGLANFAELAEDDAFRFNFWIHASLVHEAETCRRILRFGGLVQAPIAKDSGRPISSIRLRMLQAIAASASCDLG